MAQKKRKPFLDTTTIINGTISIEKKWVRINMLSQKVSPGVDGFSGMLTD